MTRHEPELPDFDELRLRARAAPDSPLDQLLAKIRTRGDEDGVRHSPAATELRQLRAIFRDALRKKGLLIAALVLAGLQQARNAASRLKTRTYESAALLAQAAATSNVFVAALLTAVLATSVTGTALRTLPAHALAVPDSTRQIAHAGSSGADSDLAATHSAGARLASELSITTFKQSVRTRNGIERQGQRLVISSVVESWAEPVVGRSGKRIWIDCDSSIRQTICATAEPVIAVVPPPPSNSRK